MKNAKSKSSQIFEISMMTGHKQLRKIMQFYAIREIRILLHSEITINKKRCLNGHLFLLIPYL